MLYIRVQVNFTFVYNKQVDDDDDDDELQFTIPSMSFKSPGFEARRAPDVYRASCGYGCG